LLPIIRIVGFAGAFRRPELAALRMEWSLGGVLLVFAYAEEVGYSRRKELREMAESILESNARIKGVTLGQVCAAGVVVLDVACHGCPRRGRYRVTRLIDRHGAGKGLTELRNMLAADCPKRDSTSVFNQCGAYFPKVAGQEITTT
jgi:hypothetical protein